MSARKLTRQDLSSAAEKFKNWGRCGPQLSAPEYLLRINYTGGPAGVKTPVHTHPGSEAFYILTGRLGMHNPHGTMHVDAGKAMNGHSPEMPMQVFNAGPDELNALVMFVVDASRPFSSPAKLP